MTSTCRRALRTASCLALLLPAAIVAPALASEGAGTLTVTVDNVVAGKGPVMAVLCTEQTFLGRCPLQASAPADGTSVRLVFKGVAPGAYAVMMFQDVDDNGVMAEDQFGAPTEPWAFSNNAQGNMGPPKWKDSVITVGEGATEIAVTLN